MSKMSLLSEIENLRTDQGAKTLAKMARLLGYHSPLAQLAFGNGATASDLFDFFEDNPGAVEAVIDWVIDQNRDKDGNSLDDEDDEVFDGDLEGANKYTISDE
jgi:hypothetical protein